MAKPWLCHYHYHIYLRKIINNFNLKNLYYHKIIDGKAMALPLSLFYNNCYHYFIIIDGKAMALPLSLLFYNNCYHYYIYLNNCWQSHGFGSQRQPEAASSSGWRLSGAAQAAACCILWMPVIYYHSFVI